jgi:3-oxoacyl-[acyl-carrier-protein] synthase-1
MQTSAMPPVSITAHTATSCLGLGVAAHTRALREGRSGLTPCHFETVNLPTWIGEVPGVDAVSLPAGLERFDCRNNRLAWLALQADGFAERVREAVVRCGADRVGVFVGTSTSGILETELAYRRRDPASGSLPPDFHYATTHNTFSVADFVRAAFGIEGMAMSLSSACSSSAKVFAAAARQLQAGTIDAAVVGGVDSLCLTTLYGFASLQLTSPLPCRPGDASRDGISIGEAAAFALLEPGQVSAPWRLLGVGESSDAHHMSAPHPEGLGAQRAMAAALRSAGLQPGDIHYINLHGTATPANDAAEGLAVAALFGRGVPCSSTKGATGHTLGAAGALEAVVCAITLAEGWLPGSPGTETVDPAIDIDYRREGSALPGMRRVLSNSFGFGGSNASLVFGKGEV